MELTQLTEDDILNDEELMNTICGDQIARPQPLTTTSYTISVEKKFIYDEILDVSFSPYNIESKWRPTKAIGVRRLFNKLFTKHPETNEFVPITDSRADVKDVQKGVCILYQQCSGHRYNCTTK